MLGYDLFLFFFKQIKFMLFHAIKQSRKRFCYYMQFKN